jgi:hypothetical protein
MSQSWDWGQSRCENTTSKLFGKDLTAHRGNELSVIGSQWLVIESEFLAEGSAILTLAAEATAALMNLLGIQWSCVRLRVKRMAATRPPPMVRPVMFPEASRRKFTFGMNHSAP